jgi:asparagine synthase (glutamine-hydrolysing)
VRWWDVDFSNPSSRPPEALGKELIEHLRTAVQSRMIADVPLGAFLSGGVDSSAVVAFMAEASRNAVETCSIGFDVPELDETAHAQLVAERFATNHRSRIVASDDYGLIDTLAEAFDEPFADASALATYRVSELAREKVTVALSGDGADETFAGYRRYRMFMAEERARGLLPAGLKRAARAFGDIYPKLDWAPQFLAPRPTLQAVGRTGEEAYADAVSVTRAALASVSIAGPESRDAGPPRRDRYVSAMREAPRPTRFPALNMPI